MIRQKTAVLIGGSLAIGALAGGAEDWIVDEYYRIGEALGIGFQIQDDLLDAFGEPEKFGKQAGGDIIENKKTFLLIRAFEKANAEEKIALNEYLQVSNSEEKVRKVLELFTKLGIKEETEQEVKKYFLLASNALENLPKEFTSEELKLFIQHIFFREH
jgi:geranylgeranyl diphosphate synthase type II